MNHAVGVPQIHAPLHSGGVSIGFDNGIGEFHLDDFRRRDGRFEYGSLVLKFPVRVREGQFVAQYLIEGGGVGMDHGFLVDVHGRQDLFLRFDIARRRQQGEPGEGCEALAAADEMVGGCVADEPEPGPPAALLFASPVGPALDASGPVLALAPGASPGSASIGPISVRAAATSFSTTTVLWLPSRARNSSMVCGRSCDSTANP